MYRGTRTPVTEKSVESDVLDGFEILLFIYYYLLFIILFATEIKTKLTA